MSTEKTGIKSFPRNFWTVIIMEFFERGSYYGVLSILSIYLTDSLSAGGLGFSKESVGFLNSVTRPLLYIIPIISGAIADRYGYRKVLLVSFVVMSTGYFVTSLMNSYWPVFFSLILTMIGAGTFKPIISGTIARSTDEKNSSLGFGIFYWTINLGAFLFPLIVVPFVKSTFGPSYILVMAAIGTGWMIIPGLLAYKEPVRPASNKTILEVLVGALKVLGDYKFILLIVIYSCFWILYFQMFDTVLWYMRDYIDVTPINNFVNGILSIFITNPAWKFDVETVTAVSAGTIILLQLIISRIVQHRKALPTMITGIGFGALGMGILAISDSPWIFLSGLFIFSIGEMTAHPKFISYVGLIAPDDKKALYLGYSFLYGVIGSLVGGILGANMYVYFVDKLHNPSVLWLIFSSIGVFTIIGLTLYNIFLAPQKK